MKRLAVVLAVLGARSAYAGDPTFAATAFDHAEQLRKDGKWADACNLYKASYDNDPQLGVLLHLADCNEHVGRFASAWAEFSDALALANRLKDPREKIARTRADAIAPRIAKLRIVQPPTTIVGLVVRRDNTDVTVMIGGALPIDPGDHVITAAAPGFVEWKQTITIAGEATVSEVKLPELQKAPEQAVEPTSPAANPEGVVKIMTLDTATILFDGNRVGIGTYEARVSAGPHRLQVVASGMRPYQDDVFVTADNRREVPVLLEKEPALVATNLPTFQVAASIAPGKKLRNDHPNVIAYRAELAFRIGARVNFGAYVELGSIDASNTCGFDLPGPMVTNPFDYGRHYQLNRCQYVKPGVQLYVHPLTSGMIDPYVGITPGIRFGLTEITPYSSGSPEAKLSETYMAYLVGARLGVDIHPLHDTSGWAIGPFVELELALHAQESCDSCDGGDSTPRTYTSLFGGVRSSLAF